MMRLAAILAVFAISTGSAFAQARTVLLDPQRSGESMQTVTLLQGEAPTLRAQVSIDGKSTTEISNDKAVLYYGTNAIGTLTAVTNDTVVAASSYFQWNLTTNITQTAGDLWYTILWYDSANRWQFCGTGTITVVESTVTE